MAALQIMCIKLYVQIILIFLFVQEIKQNISKFSNGLFVTYNHEEYSRFANEN